MTLCWRFFGTFPYLIFKLASAERNISSFSLRKISQLWSLILSSYLSLFTHSSGLLSILPVFIQWILLNSVCFSFFVHFLVKLPYFDKFYFKFFALFCFSPGFFILWCLILRIYFVLSNFLWNLYFFHSSHWLVFFIIFSTIFILYFLIILKFFEIFFSWFFFHDFYSSFLFLFLFFLFFIFLFFIFLFFFFIVFRHFYHFSKITFVLFEIEMRQMATQGWTASKHGGGEAVSNGSSGSAAGSPPRSTSADSPPASSATSNQAINGGYAQHDAGNGSHHHGGGEESHHHSHSPAEHPIRRQSVVVAVSSAGNMTGNSLAESSAAPHNNTTYQTLDPGSILSRAVTASGLGSGTDGGVGSVAYITNAPEDMQVFKWSSVLNGVLPPLNFRS